MSKNRGKENKFSKTQKKRALKSSDGVCSVCKCRLNMSTAEPHHIIPVSMGGDTTDENCSILCRDCHVEIHL